MKWLTRAGAVAACILQDKYVFPVFELALGLLFLYALGRDLRLFQRFRRRYFPRPLEATLSVIRGPESQRQFHLAYGLLSVIVLQIINAAEALHGYKTILSILNVTVLVYLCYFSSWVKNKIVTLVLAWQRRAD